MRQIKFRAWDKKQSKMFFNNDIRFLGNGEYEIWDEKNYAWITDNCELMQFTGLLDKNGKEIYEGDIVKAIGWKPENYKIVFAEGAFCCATTKQIIDVIHFISSKGVNLEVIGNIWENKEILNGNE